MSDRLPPPHEVLPHRDPFLFLDRVIFCDGRRAVGERTFVASSAFFGGHFPGQPVVPGVLLIEGLAQTLAYMALREHPGHVVLLTGVDGCKIRRQVRPGETVRYEVEVDRVLLKVLMAHGVVTVGGERCLTAKLKGYLGAPGTRDA